MDYLDQWFERLWSSDARSTSDDSLKYNAQNASGAGLEVRVTRTYDGIGLSGGRECAWCKERECTDVTLAEAYRIGAFQRHPGCGCEIEYTSAKGITTRQTRAGGRESWKEDANLIDDIAVETRKALGLPDAGLEQNKQFLRNHCGLIPDNSLRKVDQQLLSENALQIEKLNNRFGVIPKGNMVIKYDGRKSAIAGTAKDNSYMFLEGQYRNADTLIAKARQSVIDKWHMPCLMDDSTLSRYTITHEYGHAVHNHLFLEAKANGYLNSRDYFLNECKTEIMSIAVKNNPNFDYLASISEYGRDYGSAEFFAECFANSQLGAPNDLGNAMSEWLLMKGL